MEQQKQEKTLIPYEDTVEGIGIVAQEVNHWKNAIAHLRDEYPDSSAYREMAERYGMYAAALNTAMAVIQTLSGPSGQLPQGGSLLDGPARLIVAADFEDNPMMDAEGFLPCWGECTEAVREEVWREVGKDYEPDGWATVDARGLEDKSMRYWTKRPTREQMEATPWA